MRSRGRGGLMAYYKPTSEMTEFAKEVVRVSALNRHGLTTDGDIENLESMGERARFSQQAANAETDQRRGRWS